MAFIDPTKPIIARMFATATPPNKRIEIGPGTDPTVNEIRFYSGQAGETQHGFIDVQGTPTQTALDMAPPALAGAGLPLFDLIGRTAGPKFSEIYAEAYQHDFFVTAAPGTFPMLKVAASGANGDAQLTLNDGANDEVWHAAAFQSTWVNFAAAGVQDVRYRKMPDGIARLDGAFKDSGGAGVNPIFVMPVGYRPGQLEEFVCKSNNDAASVSWVQINAAGQVNVVGNVAQARVRCALSGITYLAEN